MSRLCPAPHGHDLSLVPCSQIDNTFECVLPFCRGFNDRGQEAQDPLIHVIALADKCQSIVIFAFVPLEEIRKVQRRLSQNSHLQKMQSDEHTSDSPVTVMEGVKCFKLIMGNRDADQLGHLQGLVMPEKFKVLQCLGQQVWMRRNKGCRLDRRTADPVLRRAHLSRLLVLSTDSGKKKGMRFL